jgi:hypothetical protein
MRKQLADPLIFQVEEWATKSRNTTNNKSGSDYGEFSHDKGWGNGYLGAR